MAVGLQETWKKRTAPAPKSLQFQYKIIKRWKQIRRGWGKSTKKAKEVVLLYCWEAWASLAAGSSLADVTWRCMELNYLAESFWFKKKKQKTTQQQQRHIHFHPQGIWISHFLLYCSVSLPHLAQSNAHGVFKNTFKGSCLPCTSH